MNNLIPIEYQGQRILTTKQLSEIYQTSEGNISNNFNNNMDHFTEGKHYHLLEGEALREFKRRLLRYRSRRAKGQQALPLDSTRRQSPL